MDTDNLILLLEKAANAFSRLSMIAEQNEAREAISALRRADEQARFGDSDMGFGGEAA